jgi:hypothetical protein
MTHSTDKSLFASWWFKFGTAPEHAQGSTLWDEQERLHYIAEYMKAPIIKSNTKVSTMSNKSHAGQDMRRQAAERTLSRMSQLNIYCRISERVMLDRGAKLEKALLYLTLSLALNVFLLIALVVL